MPASPQWVFDRFRLDPDHACLWRDAEALTLPPKAFDLLHYFVRHPDRVLPKDELLDAVWPQTAVTDAVVRVTIGLLRKVLGDTAQTPQFIATVARHAMMDAVHRYEGTVNQVLGDGIMALFGAPIAHEDHAARACYAALAMQAALGAYAEEVRRAHGLTMQSRIGLNSGEVVVRTIHNDLHMDYSAVGQTTHLAARLEQLASPGAIVLTTATVRLA